MATVKKEEELLTKETLLKQWNSVEGKKLVGVIQDVQYKTILKI